MTYRYACIEMQPQGTLEETAMALGVALGGLKFEEECSGKFEEYPAYVAQDDDFSYSLLGIPDPEFDIRDVRSNSFCLQMNSREPATEQKQYDVSGALLERIRNNSSLVCWIGQNP